MLYNISRSVYKIPHTPTPPSPAHPSQPDPPAPPIGQDGLPFLAMQHLQIPAGALSTPSPAGTLAHGPAVIRRHSALASKRGLLKEMPSPAPHPANGVEGAVFACLGSPSVGRTPPPTKPRPPQPNPSSNITLHTQYIYIYIYIYIYR